MSKFPRFRSEMPGLMGCLLLLFLSVVLCPALPSWGISATEKNEDGEFLKRKDTILNNFKAEKKNLLSQVEALGKEAKALEDQTQELTKEVSNYEGVRAAVSLADYGVTFLLWCFPLLVFNHLLYLLIRERAFFTRYRKPILAVFLTLEICFFLPLLTSAETGSQAPSQQETPDEFDVKLQEINKLLKMPAAERRIKVLETTREKYITIEKIPVKDLFLVPREGRLEIRSPDYYYTLAALYRFVGREEKAQEALKTMNGLPLSPEWFQQYLSIYKVLLEMYLKGNQMVEASKVALRLMDIYGAQKDVQALTDFSAYLMKSKMNESANEAVKKALEVADRGKQVTFILGYLVENNRLSDASSLLNRAVERSTSLEEVLPLLGFAIDKRFGEDSIRAITKATELCRKVEDYLMLSRTLFQKGRKEESAKILSAAREKMEKVEDLVSLCTVAREQGLLSIAIEAIERAVMVDPRSRQYSLPPPGLLGETMILPDEQPISLATFLGILQQLDRRFESAALSYKAALLNELDAILESYGYRTEGNINNFFYLKLLWQKQEPEKLRWLLPLYMHLQEGFLAHKAKVQEIEVSQLKDQITRMKEENAKKLETVASFRSRVNSLRFGITLFSLRLMAFFAMGLLIVAGCMAKGIQAYRNTQRFRFFAFYWKSQEAFGWSIFFSIVGIPLALMFIISGQFMGIIHSIEMGTYRGHLREPPHVEREVTG